MYSTTRIFHSEGPDTFSIEKNQIFSTQPILPIYNTSNKARDKMLDIMNFKNLLKNKQCIYFKAVLIDKLLIPYFDVSKANFEYIDTTFLNVWKNFISYLQMNFKNINKEIELLTSTGYNVTAIHLNEFLPLGFREGLIYNFPDVLNCTNSQLYLFLNNTGLTLDKFLFRVNEHQSLINTKIHPYNFIHLGINNSYEIVKFAKLQTSKTIWISIIIWWNYRQIDNMGEDNFIELIETYCLPNLFNCDYFIMAYARALESTNSTFIDWFENNKCNIIWDDDLLNDVPSYHLEICKNNFHSRMFLSALTRFGIEI